MLHSKLSSGNEYMDMWRADNFAKNWRNLPIAISNQISTMSIHIQTLVKIHWYLLNLLYGDENTNVLRADNFESELRLSMYMYLKSGGYR